MNAQSARILVFLSPVPPTLTKGGPGSGWFGPDHGGTHGPGASGAEPPTLPSSAGITTLEQAHAYWKAHFAKKLMALDVHGAGRDQPIPIRVRFSDTNHAYTTDAGGRQKTGQRVFDPQRAHAMDRILRTIEHPKRRLRNFYADLLLEGKAHGHHYTVVLTWREAAQVYEFHSAHFKPIQEVERLAREHEPRKNSGPLQKSEPGSGEPLPSPHSPALQTPYGVGLRPRVSPQTCWPDSANSAGSGRTAIILPALADLFKAYPPLQQAHTLLLWRDDEPGVAALLKRMATPTGARWITVHPNGKENPGVPVQIQETHAGSGVYHVIGGAGGKLNYLKLRGIKPESDYKKEAAEKRKLRQAEAKRQRDRDREAGLETSKKKEKETIAAAQRTQEKEFISTVAKAAGWTEKDIQFDHEQYAHLSPRAYQELRQQHHRDVVARAQDFVAQQAQQLLADPEHLKQALGEVPLTAPDPTTLTVNDLDPVKPPDSGRGFAPAYSQRAEGGKEAVQAEAAQRQEQRLEAHPERKRALESRQATRAQLKEELENQRPPAPPPAPTTTTLAPDQVMALMKAQKALKKQTRQAQQARQKVDEAANLEEIKAYNLEVGGRHIEDDEIVQDLADALRTTQTRALLAEAKKVSGDQTPEQALSRHLGAGAQAALDALSLTVAGHGLLDRSVVDVLGLEGAARAIAHRLHATLDPKELETLQQALGDYHVDHYTQRGTAALQEAKAYQDEAAQIELDAAQNGADLQQAQGLNRRRIQALAQARRVLGTCLGEFEMNAALLNALKTGRTGKPLEVALGKVSLESAVAQAKALGLQTGDYELDAIGGVHFLTVRPEGLDRLTQPLDADHLRRQRTALDILSGRRDEDPWRPQGIAHRPDLAAPTPPGVAPTLALPFAPHGADDLSRALEDYIGGRTADGDAPADILSDLLSNSMMERAEAVGATRDQVMAAINALAPSRDAKGKLLRAEAHGATFQQLADQFVARQYGGQRSALHRQDVPMDEVATDALHRALSAEPAGIAAFKAIGELQDPDQRALRTFFETHVAKDDPEAAALRQTLTAHEKQEPEKEATDMFGETSTNPAWQDWQNRRNDLAEELNAKTLDWPKYVTVMHGRKNAYAAMQDLIRSRVTEHFAAAYNTLRPEQPLKLGRQVIRSNLNHLDAIDPEARAARLSQERALIDSLRNRVGGQYAAGSVIEKLETARDQQEAMAQNQMGFFGAEEEPKEAPPPPLKADERHTLGHVVEQRLAAMLGVVGKNFKPGEAIKLWNPSMSGPDHVGRQRAIKLIEANRRVALSLGTGTGKSLIGLAAFTDLHHQGKIKRGIFAVPSIVQGQMGAEALRYLEPGQYQWHAEPGASRAERIAALKDPANHFVVTTHQSLRDDLLHLGAQQEGIPPEQLADRLAAQSPQDRAAWMKDLLNREGIDADYCLPYSANITLADGSNTMIGDIVENRLHTDVLCVNLETGKTENKPIVGWQKIEQNSDHLIVVHAGNQSVTCTEDHKIWTANRGYIRAVDIKPGDELVAIPFELSKISPENETTTQGIGYVNQRHDSRIAARGFLYNIIWRRNAEIKNEAFSPSERIPHTQIRNFERYLPIHAKNEKKWRFWYRTMDFSNQLHDVVSRIVRGLLPGWEKAAYGSHSEVFKPDCSGLLVHGRWQQIVKHSNDKHSRIFERAAAFFSRVDQGEIRIGNYRNNGQAKKPVLHANEENRSTKIFQSDWGVCAGMYAVQTNQYFPGLSPTIIRDDTRQAMLYLWNQLCERIGLHVSIMSSGGNQTKESVLVSKKQGINLRAKNGSALGAPWLSILRDLRRIVSSKNNITCHLLNRVQQGKETQVCTESLLPTNEIRTREREIAPICNKTIPQAKIIVTSTSRVSAPRYVYDLTVADNHNFFAYGILVSNCFFDESHALLNRAGKENSRMANVLDALSANTPYYVNATADPVKNSVDEAFDLLAKMDPARYTDRAAFMRRYGVDSAAARAALQREMAPYQITGRIESGQAVQRRQETVPLSEAQRRDLEQVSRHLANLRLSRMRGGVDVEAARALSPDAFAKVPADQHAAVARRLARSIGVLKEAAIHRVLDAHPEGGKLAAIDRLVRPGGELHGQPGVIFAHSLEAVRHIAERLERAGHRVVTLTGSDSSKVKAQKKAQFAPEVGPAQADILITSDAGAVGMNAQRGRWLIQHDTPQTAMNHNQRNGRVDRVGQQHDVQLIDLIHDHPAERTARERLSKKYELREIMTAPQVGLDDTGLAGYLIKRRAEAPEPAAEERLAKAIFRNQPGYDLRADKTPKRRWHSILSPEEHGGGGSSGATYHATGTHPEAPIALPDGSLEFGAITPDIVQAAHQPLVAAPVRLLVGAHQNQHRGFGAAHIQAQHGHEIAKTGLSIPAFVRDVLAHYHQIWQQPDGRLALVRTGRHGRIAVVELRQNKGFYSVVTAYPRLPEIRMKGRLVWTGRTVSHARSGRDTLGNDAPPPDPDFQPAGSPGPSAGMASKGPPKPGIAGLGNQTNTKPKVPPRSKKGKVRLTKALRLLPRARVLFFLSPQTVA